jgi:hypothetical protein
MNRLPHLAEIVPGLHILEGENTGRFPTATAL